MSFLLKKIIAGLLLPLPLCLILLLIGASVLLWTQARKAGVAFMSAGILILLLFSISPVADQLLTSLETQYQPLKMLPNNIKYIVVLGGGNGGSKHAPPNTQLSSASLSRLIEGIRLYRQNRDSILILSGGRVFGSRADANIMNNTALALGVKRDHMIIEAGSRDTLQEAKHLQPIIKNQPIVLVTSAYHMPRAMNIFKQYGMHPIPAPTQFLAKHYQGHPQYYLPTVVNLIHSDIALHEYLGMVWLRVSLLHG